MSNVAIIIVMLFKSLRHQLLFMLFVLRKCHKCALHFASTKLQRTLSLMRALCLTHENASMAKDSFNRGRGSRHTVHGRHELTKSLELLILKHGLDSGVRRSRSLNVRLQCTAQRCWLGNRHRDSGLRIRREQ